MRPRSGSRNRPWGRRRPSATTLPAANHSRWRTTRPGEPLAPGEPSTLLSPSSRRTNRRWYRSRQAFRRGGGRRRGRLRRCRRGRRCRGIAAGGQNERKGKERYAEPSCRKNHESSLRCSELGAEHYTNTPSTVTGFSRPALRPRGTGDGIRHRARQTVRMSMAQRLVYRNHWRREGDRRACAGTGQPDRRAHRLQRGLCPAHRDRPRASARRRATGEGRSRSAPPRRRDAGFRARCRSATSRRAGSTTSPGAR